MNRILRFNLLLLGMLSFGVFGQQEKLLTHFMYDKMSLNPGATGADVQGVCAASAYRNQWDKIAGAPNSFIFNVEANTKRYILGNIGASFYLDAIGYNKQNNFLINYSLPIYEQNGNSLFLGVGVGITNFSITPDWHPAQTMLDNYLPTNFSATGLDANLGLFFKSNTGFYGGLSSVHLNSARLTQKQNNVNQIFQMNRHYYLMAGYKKFLGQPQAGSVQNAIDVQFLVRSILSKTSFDFNARFFYKNIGYAGLTYRNSDAISLMLGYNINASFLVGYSYDITVNKLAGYSKGSHEIMLKYCRPLPVPPKTISRNPRFL